MRLAYVCALLSGVANTAVVISSPETASLARQIPPCAAKCISESLTGTNCTSTDFACICATPQISISSALCIIASCTIKESLTTRNITDSLCEVPIRDKSILAELVTSILTGVGMLFVVMRVIAREPWKTDLFGWDDTFIVFTFLICCLLAVDHYFLGRTALGRDIWHIHFHDITKMLKWFYIGELAYIAATILMKISILLFYLRIFPRSRFTFVVKCMIGLTTIIGTIFMFFSAFQCWPISYSWTKWSGETHGSCTQVDIGVFIHGGMNMVLDLAILLLPLPKLRQLQLNYSWQKKARIFIMFSVGLIVTLISTLRFRTLILFAHSNNPTWDFLGVTIWSGAEAAVGVICACLPATKVFMTKIIPRWLGMKTKQSKSYASRQPGQVERSARKWNSTRSTEAKDRDFVELAEVESQCSEMGLTRTIL